MTEPAGEDRAAAIARARALMAERAASSPAAADPVPASAAAAPRPASTPKHPASAGRIMAAGVAASASLMLVATMAASARATEEPAPAAPQVAQPQVVHRVITIEIPVDAVAGVGSPQEVTAVREPQGQPVAAQAPEPAPAESEGS